MALKSPSWVEAGLGLASRTIQDLQGARERVGRIKRPSDFQHLSQLRGREGQREQIKAALPRRAQLELVWFEVLCGLAKFPILCCFETAAVHSGKGHRTPQATPEMREVADLVRCMVPGYPGKSGPHVELPGRARSVDSCKNAASRKAGDNAKAPASRAAAGWMAQPGWLPNWKNGRSRIPSSVARRKSDAGDTAWSLRA